MKHFHVRFTLMIVLVSVACMTIGCENKKPESKQKQDQQQEQDAKQELVQDGDQQQEQDAKQELVQDGEQQQEQDPKQELMQDGDQQQEPSPTNSPILSGAMSPYGIPHVVNGKPQFVDSDGVYTTDIPENGTAYVRCDYLADPLWGQPEQRTIWVGIDNSMSVVPKNCVLRVQICAPSNPSLYEPYFDKLDDKMQSNGFPIIRVWVEDKDGAVLNTYDRPLFCILETNVEESDIYRVVAISNDRDEQLEYVYESSVQDNPSIQKAIRITLMHPCEAITFISKDLIDE